MKKKIKAKINRKAFYDNPLFISGVPRSGKTMLAPIISSLDRAEKINVNVEFEFITMLNKINTISDRAAITMMRYFIDIQVYENMIGRNMNFRLSDWTSVWNTSKPIKYIARLNKAEGDDAYECIKKTGQIFSLIVHDGLYHARIYFKAFPHLKMIHIDRHPVDIIYSWFFKKGYGANFWDNPRNDTLTIEWNKNHFPYYAHGWEEEYASLTEIDRIIRIINVIQSSGKDAYDSIAGKKKENIMFVKFDEIVQKPLPILSKIYNFIGTKKTKYTPIIMDKEKVPRKLAIHERLKKHVEIKKLANEESNKLLQLMIAQYESF